MSIVSTQSEVVAEARQQQKSTWINRIIVGLHKTWEIYPILLIATFFRVFAANKVNFGGDMADIYQIARDAVTHHILPATSNRSSTGILHGPFSSYFYMVAALFSSDPMWAAVETGLWNVLGVLVTYLFVRRYYGRLAGSLSSAFYAVCTVIVLYNRFIWQPNLVPPLVILLVFALFWGGVERRKGWLIPTAALIALLYQTHESSIYLLVPIAVAALFATYKTVRWWEIPLAGIVVLFIFWPYLTWLFTSNFVDIYTLREIASLPTHLTDNVFQNYGWFFSPYVTGPYTWNNTYPNDPSSVLNVPRHFIGAVKVLLFMVHAFLPAIAFIGACILVLQLCISPATVAVKTRNRFLTFFAWLRAYYDNPQKRGLALLLIWQGILPLFLIRETISEPLYDHYMMFLIPGPYILLGIGISKAVEISGKWFPGRGQVVRLVIYTITFFLLLGEIIGSLGLVVDTYKGHFDSSVYYPIYTSDMSSVKNALTEADQLAQAHHISRIYISANPGSLSPLRYFAESMTMHAQVSIIDNYHNCDVLPSPSAGAVVYLVAPYSPVTDTILRQYAHATLVTQPARLGGEPFKLYIVQTKSEVEPGSYTFSHEVQITEPKATRISVNASGQVPISGAWMIVHASTSATQLPAWRSSHDYVFTISNTQGQTAVSECITTRVQAGDQLFPGFPLNQQSPSPLQLNISVASQTYVPQIIHSGPIQFLTFNEIVTKVQILTLSDGKQTAVIAGS